MEFLSGFPIHPRVSDYWPSKWRHTEPRARGQVFANSSSQRFIIIISSWCVSLVAYGIHMLRYFVQERKLEANLAKKQVKIVYSCTYRQCAILCMHIFLFFLCTVCNYSVNHDKYRTVIIIACRMFNFSFFQSSLWVLAINWTDHWDWRRDRFLNPRLNDCLLLADRSRHGGIWVPASQRANKENTRSYAMDIKNGPNLLFAMYEKTVKRELNQYVLAS